jgi:phosphatidylglycerophosphate synthase
MSQESGAKRVRLIGESPIPIWGLKGTVRLMRAFERAGARDVALWPGSRTAEDPLLVRADYAMDGTLVAGLMAMGPALLVDPATGSVVAACAPAAEAPALAAWLGGGPAPQTGLPRLTPAELPVTHDKALRRKGAGLLKPIAPGTREAVERALFGASYKGVTDIVTKYVWPEPAFHVTRLCTRLGLSANAVTALSAVLVVAAILLFLRGQYGLGLVAAWIMTFLDTVDGKLARVTVTSSQFGNVLDHGIDLIHPPIWYWAWLAGLGPQMLRVPYPALVLAIVIGGYVLQRVQEGIFLAWFKMEIHVWRPFDSRFRLITARRNPNLVLLTLSALFGRPDLGILAVAAWTLLSLAVHGIRMIQAGFARARHGALSSWLTA